MLAIAASDAFRVPYLLPYLNNSFMALESLTLPCVPVTIGNTQNMKVSSWLAAVPALLLLAACGSPYPLFTSDGRQTTMVDCTGGDWNLCVDRAKSICPSTAYDTVDRRDDGNSRGLLIACKPGVPAAQSQAQ